MLAGASGEDKELWHLSGKTPNDFPYLNHSGCISIPGVNDNKEYAELKEAMHTLFDDQQVSGTSPPTRSLFLPCGLLDVPRKQLRRWRFDPLILASHTCTLPRAGTRVFPSP